MPPPATVRVELDPAYEVHVGRGALAGLGERARSVAPGRHAFVIADSGVPTALVEKADLSLTDAGFATTTYGFTPSERAKSLRSLEPMLRALGEARHERSEPVVVIGGGVTGDVGGFASAIYRRGTPVIQCPTTLLAMVDASVGGKTGVNLEAPSESGAAAANPAPGNAANCDDSGGGALLKNFIGAFHQPSLVVADVDALASLEPRIFRCGLSECVKHAMIGQAGDPDLGAWLSSRLDDLLAHHTDALAELVVRNVRVKAAIVSGDVREERDSGGRALLNLGHTFAHTIETLPHLSPAGTSPPLMHGEAVALGLAAASEAACRLDLLDRAERDDLLTLLARIGLPTSIAGLPPDNDLLSRMSHDKKVRAGKLRLVLPVSGATAVIREDVPDEVILAGLSALRADSAGT